MMAASLPLLCIAGTDEGEVLMVDWKTCTDVERGAGTFCSCFDDFCLNFTQISISFE